jgi:hypothetical protein
MNKNFAEVNLMEMEKEVVDINGNEICTDRTLWDILCEMCAPHYILLCDCFLLISLGK